MIKTINHITSLLRIRQWYKNLLIFLALFFSGNFFHGRFWIPIIIGFFSLSFISSAGYIINDFRDLRYDRRHPEKKYRPLASGAIGKELAVIICLLCLFVGFSLALLINTAFVIFPVGIFLITLLYSFFLKNIMFADILTVASLFTLRAVSGAYAIQVVVSPWLLLCPFFLALFIVVGKRHADLSLLKEKAGSTRETLRHYTLPLTNSLITISTTATILCYALYALLGEHQYLWYTLPFALFVILRYYHLIMSGSEIARHPEKLVRDKQLMAGIFLWIILTMGIVYG